MSTIRADREPVLENDKWQEWECEVLVALAPVTQHETASLSRFLLKFPTIFPATFIWEFPLPPGATRTKKIQTEAMHHVQFSFNKLGNFRFRGYKITAIFTIYRGVASSTLLFHTHTNFPTHYEQTSYNSLQYFEMNDSLCRAHLLSVSLA